MLYGPEENCRGFRRIHLITVRLEVFLKRAQPRKGRYFPLTPAEAWAEARRYGLVGEQSERDTRLLFVNFGRALTGGTPLVEVEGHHEVRLFSVPEGLNPEEARRAMLRALELAASHRDTAAKWTRLKRLSVFIVLTEDERLMVVQQTRWYQGRKYRDSVKFSTAFKMRKMKSQEQSLGTYPL